MAPALRPLLLLATLLGANAVASFVAPSRSLARARSGASGLPLFRHKARSSSWCSMIQEIKWESSEGMLKANGQTFNLKGINWYGFETTDRCLHGITKYNGVQKIDTILTFLQENGFNAIRLPFSVAMALDLDSKNPKAYEMMDDDLGMLTTRELLSRIIDKCGAKGILVCLDNHRLTEDYQSPLWYGDGYSSEQFISAWDNILNTCKYKGNVFALDIKNEPHGLGPRDRLRATWGDNNPSLDWKKFCEYAINGIIDKHREYKGLFMVEGIEMNYANSKWRAPYSSWWGGSLRGLYNNEDGSDDGKDGGHVKLKDGNTNRVVYSPHMYGPGHTDLNSPYVSQSYFTDAKFPTNMASIWWEEWAFAAKKTGKAVVIGEWGGYCVDKEVTIDGKKVWLKDRVWHTTLAKFMTETGLTNSFYWCLNPVSGFTGGLLGSYTRDDGVVVWDVKNANQDKLGLLKGVVPNPTKVTWNNGYTVG